MAITPFLPYDLERLVHVLGADVLLGEREALRDDALPRPTVAMFGAPRLFLEARRATAGSKVERDLDRLTQGEIDVLRELARGESNRAIAARLHISENTGKFHIAAIFAKLGTSSRTEAVTGSIRSEIVML